MINPPTPPLPPMPRMERHTLFGIKVLSKREVIAQLKNDGEDHLYNLEENIN